MLTDNYLEKKLCNPLNSMLNLTHKIQWDIVGHTMSVLRIRFNMENTPQASHCDAQIGGSLIWGDCHAI